MKRFSRIVLFLVSYIPLYLILAVREILREFEKLYKDGLDKSLELLFSKNFIAYINELNEVVVFVLLTLVMISFLCCLILLKRTEATGGRSAKIIAIENETDKHLLSYISVYLVSCIWISLNNFPDVFTLFSITLIIGYIYVANNLMYINPVLSIVFKYKIYTAQVKFAGTNEVVKRIIISKSTTIEPDKVVDLVESDGTYLFHVKG